MLPCAGILRKRAEAIVQMYAIRLTLYRLIAFTHHLRGSEYIVGLV